MLNSFLLFLTWYSLFILAFGLSFYILLHKDNGEVEFLKGHDLLQLPSTLVNILFVPLEKVFICMYCTILFTGTGTVSVF